jgi:iron complex transport system permease protein
VSAVLDDRRSVGRPVPDRSPAPALASRRSSRAFWLAVAAALLVGAGLLSLAIGSKAIPLRTVVDALLHFDGSDDHLIVRDLRVPRTLFGLTVGAALGVAGALAQALTRNPLADPGLLGVSEGAALAIVLGVVVMDPSSGSALIWLAFVGAAAASVVVYLLGSVGRGGATPVRLALAGAALTAFLGSIISTIALLDVEALDRLRSWMVGSLAGREAEVIGQVLPFLAIGLVTAIALGRPLNAIALGDETAHALGTNVGRTRAIAAVAVILLAGAATAACGPIAFVGLVVPHAARLVCGPDQRWLIPYSAVLGAIVLLICDVAGRIVARPAEIQVGIMAAAIGGPVFVVLARRVRMSRL